MSVITSIGLFTAPLGLQQTLVAFANEDNTVGVEPLASESGSSSFRSGGPASSGRRKPVSYAVLIDTLRRHRGRLSLVAKDPAVHMSLKKLRRMIRNAKKGSLLAMYHRRSVAEERLDYALWLHKGNRGKAAIECRITVSAVTHRIQRCKEGSCLEEFLTAYERLLRMPGFLRINLLRFGGSGVGSFQSAAPQSSGPSL